MADAETRAWKIVLDSIEGRLLSGELVPGDHLQPERALAVELNVGRSSVREALRVLEVFGLIRTQTGSGPQSGAIIIASPSSAIGALMRMQVAARGFEVGDIVRTRLLLETAVVADLAERSDSVDLAAAAALLDAMEAPRLTQAEFLALDAQFHLSLAEASENQVVATMMTGLRSSIEGYVLEGAEGLPDWTATAERLRTEHRAILMAIIAGDREAATEQVHNHISGYYAETHLTSARHNERPDHG
ncbi:MAG TPA: FCD domain-containing protein [Lacisediminihabitans sp.]|jgi:DNA-binding FadR family transcriptional regulator|nr:FCD domain-containing protein [Lacisediminihabitans sp.]HXD62572.1 FCD domain-containing protein [Lacisediminihabitans sp.]